MKDDVCAYNMLSGVKSKMFLLNININREEFALFLWFEGHQ